MAEAKVATSRCFTVLVEVLYDFLADVDRRRVVHIGVEPARGLWTSLGRLPLRVFSIGNYAFQKKVPL